VAISWEKSENKLANPMPSTVRFSQPTLTRFCLIGSFEGAVTEGFVGMPIVLQNAQKKRDTITTFGGATPKDSYALPKLENCFRNLLMAGGSIS